MVSAEMTVSYAELVDRSRMPLVYKMANQTRMQMIEQKIKNLERKNKELERVNIMFFNLYGKIQKSTI